MCDLFSDIPRMLYAFNFVFEIFVLGNEIIYRLVTNRKYRLRVVIKDWNGEILHADCSAFSIASSNDNYALSVGVYSGAAGNLSFTALMCNDNISFAIQ